MKNKFIRLFVSALSILMLFSQAYSQVTVKPKVIVTTDLGADPDDQQSLVRFVVSCNNFDIKGIVTATSCWRKGQDATNMNKYMNPLLSAYESAYNNLKVHSSEFPTPAYLRSVTVLGNTGYGYAAIGSGKDSPGSNLIIATVDATTVDQPICVQSWGGSNTLAQALWKVKSTRTQAQLDEFISKVYCYDILGQDDAGAWIAVTFPNLIYIRATSVYGWQRSKTDSWWSTNVQSHGALGAVYPNGIYAMEGDSPALLHCIANGLNNPADPKQRGWGGQFVSKKANIASMSAVSGEGAWGTYYMYGNSLGLDVFKQAIENDFQARMDWANSSSFSSANHHPVVAFNGDKTKNIVKMNVTAGQTVSLNASGTTDPDGNSLSYQWSYYQTDGTYGSNITISNSSSQTASVIIPSNALNQEMHFVVAVSDNGNPSLTSYRRVIIKATNGTPIPVAPTVSLTAPANNASFPAPASITISANAADADGTVSKVDFYNGTTLLGTDATAPYSYTWTGVAAGTYSITAKASDNSSLTSTSSSVSISVTAANVDVTGISVTPETVSTYIGQTVSLSASILPSNATNKNVSWTSSNTSIATVNSTGVVTAVSKGIATITATTQQGSYTDASVVTVGDAPAIAPLVKLAFNDNTGTSVTNSGTVSATFTKTAIPAWSANVPVNGGVSSVDFGTTNGNNYVESGAVISQLAGLTSFTITGWVNCKNSTVGSGGNRIVSWINNGGNGVDLVYQTDGSLRIGINQWPDMSSAVSSVGKITTDASASASNWKFFAISYQSTTGALSYYFGDNATAASLDKSLTYSKGAVGTSIGSLAIGHFNTQSSRTSRTDRMFKGLIDQVEIYGSALTLQDIQSIQNITVAPVAVTSVSITPATATVSVNTTSQLTANVLPANASNKNVSFSSSDTTVAKVSVTGLLTALSEGSATITVTTEDGSKTATSTISVIVPVASVSLSSVTTTVNASNKNVSYSSSNPAVASVGETGLVKALSSGTATITVTTQSGSKTASATVSVNVPVAGITLAPATASVTMGSTVQLTATILPAGATNKSVTYTTSDASIATVNTTGLVSGISEGSATITATTVDGAFTATTVDGAFTATSVVEVSRVAVTGVSLTPATVSLVANATSQLSAAILPVNATNKSLTYTTSDASIATVSATGLVTAKAAGTATITVTTQDGAKTATSVVTVTPVSTDNIEIRAKGVAGSEILQLTIDGTVVKSWTLSTSFSVYTCSGASSGVFKVNFTNDATGRDVQVDYLKVNGTSYQAEDQAINTSFFANGKCGGGGNSELMHCTGYIQFTITNTVIVPVTGVSVTPAPATVSVGSTTQLTATVSPANVSNKNITWASSNTSVATVSTTGLVTGVSAGTATITVTTADGAKTASSVVTVSVVPVASVSVSPTSATVSINSTTQLTATVLPTNAPNKNVTWTSSNTLVATVNASGLVTAVAIGSATITVTTVDGAKTASASITVSNISVTGVSMSPTTASLSLNGTTQLTATVSPANASNKNITWASSNTSVATVSTTGLVTGKAAGTATITVTTADGNKTATCVVTVTSSNRLRVVMSTDFPPLDVCMSGCAADHTSDPDDVQSMVRFLLYANEFDVEGLIASSGTFAGIAKKQNIIDILNLYDKVDENLRTHDSRYPTADALKAVTYQGRSGTWGNSTANNIGSGKDSEASDAIISIVDKADSRPIYFGVWGDCSNIAQAIWKVQNTRTPAQLQAFLSKMRIFQIAHQDATIDWLMNSFPNLFIIYSANGFSGMYGGLGSRGDQNWINTNIKQNHGPLGAVYPLAAMGVSGIKEGDSPSFMWLISAAHGLNNPEDPTQPSWGGKYVKSGSTNHYVDGGGSSISQWQTQFQTEFATRADWMVSTLKSNEDITETTSSDDITTDASEVLLWPNPTSNEIKISSVNGFSMLKVYDYQGKLVLEKSYDEEMKYISLQFDLSKGLYNVTLIGSQNTNSMKLIVE